MNYSSLLSSQRDGGGVCVSALNCTASWKNAKQEAEMENLFQHPFSRIRISFSRPEHL